MVVETGEIDAGATARHPSISGQPFVNPPNPPVEAFSQGPSSGTPFLISPDDTCRGNCYEIEGSQQSESALVLFTRRMRTSERVVMKILRDYKDSRYSLETVGKRQQCQLEAFQRNKVFTSEVYIGLACIHDWDPQQKNIRIGEIIENPTKEMLDPHAEYALLMHQLPEHRRLDCLLKEKEDASLQSHVQILTEHLRYIHTYLISSISDENGVRWGSYEQLRKKLLHNCALLDLVLMTNNNGLYSTYNWSEKPLNWLKKTLLEIFMQDRYHSYFEQRVREQRIKRCHGDLKSPNIWILSYDRSCDRASGQYVKVLDAIDFNPSYSNIDTLSDFAMLVIDVQTRTKSVSLANEMIEYYLTLTDQEDEVARSVLGYYLVEKAIVGAAVSIVYDNLPDLGMNLLDVAEMRLKSLVDMQH